MLYLSLALPELIFIRLCSLQYIGVGRFRILGGGGGQGLECWGGGGGGQGGAKFPVGT